MKRNLYNFVVLALEKRDGKKPKPKQVLNTICKVCGLKIDVSGIDFGYDKEVYDYVDNVYFSRKYKKEPRQIKVETLDESLLEKYKSVAPIYLIKKEIPPALLKFFEIGYSPEGLNEKYISKNFPGRIIVPIRDMDNNLVGLSGRLATDKKHLIKRYGKYRHILNFKKGAILYNLNHAKRTILDTRTVFLVEGFFDVINLWGLGIQNVVALMGNHISREQVLLLLPMIEHVYIMLDGDEGGREGAISVAQSFRGLCNVYDVVLKQGIDPGEILSREELESFLKKAKKII